jgi:hypothetical protein
MKINNLMLALTSAAVCWCGPAALTVSAQVAPPSPLPAYQPLTDQQLDTLLGPIALYPDPLLAQILPAATLPTQIVLADRYLTSGGDPSQIDQQLWDPSVQAVARYPSVLQYLDNNLGWTTELGLAFLNQQQEVMESVQRLRQSAMNYGNLQSTPQQQVVVENGYIEILPTEQDVFYLPVYQPADVFDQSGYAVGFGVACALGPWLNCDFDWHGWRLWFWDRNRSHPANWWRERPDQRGAWLASQGTVWRPEDHRGYAPPSQGDRGWINSASRSSRGNSIIVNMSKSGARANTAAAPSPAVVRESRPFQVATPSGPAPVVHPASNGAFIGSESSRDARTFSNRGQESMQTVTHSEPVHVEPPHSEPAHFEAPVSHEPPPAAGGGGGRR